MAHAVGLYTSDGSFSSAPAALASFACLALAAAPPAAGREHARKKRFRSVRKYLGEEG